MGACGRVSECMQSGDAQRYISASWMFPWCCVEYLLVVVVRSSAFAEPWQVENEQRLALGSVSAVLERWVPILASTSRESSFLTLFHSNQEKSSTLYHMLSQSQGTWANRKDEKATTSRSLACVWIQASEVISEVMHAQCHAGG